MWHHHNSEKYWNSSEHRCSNSASNISHRLCSRTIPFSWFACALLKQPGVKKQKIISKIKKVTAICNSLTYEIIPFVKDWNYMFSTFLNRELIKNHDDDGNKTPTNLHIWKWKTVFLHALHVHFSSFDILKTFSFFLTLRAEPLLSLSSIHGKNRLCTNLVHPLNSP